MYSLLDKNGNKSNHFEKIGKKETENYQDYDESFLDRFKELSLKFSREVKTTSVLFNNSNVIPTEKWKEYNWVILCIAYALYKENISKILQLELPNPEGVEIKGDTLFQDKLPFWVAYLNELMFLDNPEKQDFKLADFANLVRKLAHFGALELKKEWDKSLDLENGKTFDAKIHFLKKIVNPALKNNPKKFEHNNNDKKDNTVKDDKSTNYYAEILKKCGIPIKELRFVVRGVRYDIFEVECDKSFDLNNKIANIAQYLGKSENRIMDGGIVEGKSLTKYLKILRPENEWKVFADTEFQEALNNYQGNFELPVCLGLNERGEPIFKDYYDAPHSIIGGTTGSGKSVAIKVMLHSLLKLTPKDNLEVLILDPKKVDYQNFSEQYNNCELIVNNNEMETVIYQLAEEMDNRYTILQKRGVKKITDIATNERPFKFKLVMIDELADLLDTNEDLAEPLTRLAQKGRAAGIVLILSTQKPDATALGKKGAILRAVLPTKIAFKVDKEANSKIILDETGAEKLAGKGDHFIKWFGTEKIFLHGYNI